MSTPHKDKTPSIGCTETAAAAAAAVIKGQIPRSLQFLPSLLLGIRSRGTGKASNGKIDVRLFQNFQLSPAATEAGGMLSMEKFNFEGFRVSFSR